MLCMLHIPNQEIKKYERNFESCLYLCFWAINTKYFNLKHSKRFNIL